MTIKTNIGDFGNWYSLKREMINNSINQVKVNDYLCISNTISLGSIQGYLSLKEVEKLERNEVD